MMRGWGDIGTGNKATDYFRQNLKIFPLESGPRAANYINTAGMGLNSLAPEVGSAFEMLNEIIQYEPQRVIRRRTTRPSGKPRHRPGKTVHSGYTHAAHF